MTLAVAKRTPELEAVKLRGLYWWSGRWRTSTAYMRMTLAEQGAYRNLLDVAFLHGGALPAEDRALAVACGDPLGWPKVRAMVLQWFYKVGNTWRNETLDSVMEQSQRRANKQRAYRERLNGNGNGHAPARRKRR